MKKEEITNCENIRKHLDEIDRHMSYIRKYLFAEESVKGRTDFFQSPDGRIVEGIFNGEEMVDGEGNTYPVSPNYASKSQLVVGDKLKLTIAPDGRFMYKQIGPVDRKRIVCTLEKNGNQYNVICPKKKYQILLASVTYFKAEIGDKLTVVVPSEGKSDWAAVENVVGKE